MTVRRLAAGAALLFLVLPVAPAQAFWRVGIGIGVPVYRPYYPVYVAPAPVYVVQPAPVYYTAPAPAYAPPAQSAYPPPAAQPERVPAPAPAPTAPTLPPQPVPVPIR